MAGWSQSRCRLLPLAGTGDAAEEARRVGGPVEPFLAAHGDGRGRAGVRRGAVGSGDAAGPAILMQIETLPGGRTAFRWFNFAAGEPVQGGASDWNMRLFITGMFANADLVPKPLGRLPMLVTGNSGQPLPWIAGYADGWITYPRGIDPQAETVTRWRRDVHDARPGAFKPFVQSLYVDLADDPHLPPSPIHLGFRAGRHYLLSFLDSLRGVGVNHVILNFKYGARPASEVLEEIGTEVLPRLADAQVDKPAGGELEPSDAEVDDTVAPQH